MEERVIEPVDPQTPGQIPKRRFDPTSPWILLPTLAFSLLLMLPSFEIGFALDDYAQIGLIEDWYGIDTPALNLYNNFLDLPDTPWWVPPEARVAFWRPLSSALLHLDHALFGRQAFYYHLHALLWLAALIAAAALLYSRLPSVAGAVALVLLAADESHAFTSGVICNRHAVVTVVPALLGLYAHLRWREDGWKPGRLLAVVGFAVALLAGETALSVAAYALAYELFGAPGRIRQRLRAIAPITLLVVVYLLVYKALGMGPNHVGFYLNPFDQPLEYLIALAKHMPALLAGGLAATPASMWMVPEFRLPLIFTGLFFTGLLAWILRLVWPHLSDVERRALRWWLPGALGSMLPVAAAHPSDRQLLVPMLGLAVLFGVLISHAVRRWRETQAKRQRLAAGTGITLIVLLHLVAASQIRVAKQQDLVKLGNTLDDVAETLPALARDASTDSPSDLVLIVAGDFFTIVYPPLIHDYHHGASKLSWNVLSAAPFAHRLTRTSVDTLELESVDGQFLHSDFERLWGPEKLEPGDIFDTQLFRVEVLDENSVGPTHLAFRFNTERSLESSSLAFLIWRDGGLERLDVPAIGESVMIERTSGLFGLL